MITKIMVKLKGGEGQKHFFFREFETPGRHGIWIESQSDGGKKNNWKLLLTVFVCLNPYEKNISYQFLLSHTLTFKKMDKIVSWKKEVINFKFFWERLLTYDSLWVRYWKLNIFCFCSILKTLKFLEKSNFFKIFQNWTLKKSRKNWSW